MSEDNNERAAAKKTAKAPSQKQRLTPLQQAKAAKLTTKWQSYQNKARSIKTTPYNMKNQYEKSAGIQHKTLGWGYIIDNRNGRLEVLFQDGIKYLISNYK
jgi:hypothetical protein